MRKTFWSMLAVAMLLAGSRELLAQAQEGAGMKPVVVVSFGGYQALKDDLTYLGTLSGNPELAGSLDAPLMLFTQGQGLAGLDAKRPWGAVVSSNGVDTSAVVFLPVSDLKKLLGALAGLVGEAEDAGDGVVKIQPGNQSVFVKEQNGWAFVGQTAEALSKLPKDPLATLGGLEKKYDLAIRANVRNIPDFLRQMAIDQFKAGVESGLERKDEESDAQYEIRKQVTQQQMDAMVTLLDDMEQLTLGFSIDSAGKKTFLDVTVTAVEGSKTAKQLAESGTAESKFAGFRQSGALLSTHMASKISEQEIGQIQAMLGTLRGQLMSELDKDENLPEGDVKDAVKGLVNELVDVVEATVKEGLINAGLTVTGGGPYTLVAGGFVADGAKIEEIVKKAVDMAKNEPGFPELKLDAETYQGVRFHTVSIPIPEDKRDENTQKLLGDTLDVTLGFGKQSAYVAVGKEGVTAIKKVIDGSAKPSGKLPPLDVTLSLAPIMQLIAESNASDPVAGMAASTLKEGGKDHVQLTANLIDRGFQYRIEAEEGILKLLGISAKVAAARSGVGGF